MDSKVRIDDSTSPVWRWVSAVLAVLCVVLVVPMSLWRDGVGLGLPWGALGLLCVLGALGILVRGIMRPVPGAAILLGGLAVFLGIGAGIVQPTIEWDGAGYYAQARSIAFDGNLDFHNEVELEPSLGYLVRVTPRERLGVPFPVGPALTWLPFLPPARALGGGATGFEVPYRLLVMFISLVVVAGGTWLLMHTPNPVRNSGRLDSTGSAVVVLFVAASMVPVYVWLKPAYSHAYQFAASALAAWWCVRLWCASASGELAITPIRQVAWLPLVTGAVIGLSFLMRWQGVTIALVFLVPLWMTMRCLWKADRVWEALYIPVGTVVAFGVMLLPQMLVIGRTWGIWFGLPQMEENFFDLSRPAVGGVLFSTWNGLFVYHPVLLLGAVAAGASLFRKGVRVFAGMVLLWMAVEVYVVSCTLDWHGGGAFGQRRLAGFVPWLALFAAWQAGEWKAVWQRGALGIVLGVLVVVNTLHAGAYAHYRVPPSPADSTNYIYTNRQDVYGMYDYGRAWGDIARGGGYFLVRTVVEEEGGGKSEE